MIQGNEFFSFQKMITLRLITIIYPLGMSIISIIGIVLVVLEFNTWFLPSQVIVYSLKHRGLFFIIGIVIITIGNLFWRLMCERWILFFRMHALMESMDKEIKWINNKLYKK